MSSKRLSTTVLHVTRCADLKVLGSRRKELDRPRLKRTCPELPQRESDDRHHPATALSCAFSGEGVAMLSVAMCSIVAFPRHRTSGRAWCRGFWQEVWRGSCFASAER